MTCMKLTQLKGFQLQLVRQFDNKVQGWRTHQAGKFTHKTYAYRWINHDKDITYKLNYINTPIG